MRFLFDAHDHIANKDYVPELPDFSKMMMDEDSSIKIVRLVKSNEPLVSVKLEHVSLFIEVNF